MFLHILLTLVLVGQVPNEYKKYIENNKYPRERVKKILLGEELPPMIEKKDVEIEPELSEKEEFFAKEHVSMCIFHGFDKEGNIIVEVPDYVVSKKLKLAANPVILDEKGKDISRGSLKDGDWIKVFIDDDGDVRGIIRSQINEEEVKE